MVLESWVDLSRDRPGQGRSGTVIRNLLAGEYRRPVRVVAFNTSEFWSRDVSEDVAWEMINRAVQAHVYATPPIALLLPMAIRLFFKLKTL